jgi:hypothetical protein
VKSPLQNANVLFAIGLSSLFVGSAFVYISIKAPFYWGGAFLPGVLLLLFFVVAALLGVITVLRRPVRASPGTPLADEARPPEETEQSTRTAG